MMPQAKPEQYIANINTKLQQAAAAGKSSITIYEGQCGLSDIGSTESVGCRTLAASVASILQRNGYTVAFKRGYGDQRDYVNAHMIISW